jgi:hypothetical protein
MGKLPLLSGLGTLVIRAFNLEEWDQVAFWYVGTSELRHELSFHLGRKAETEKSGKISTEIMYAIFLTEQLRKLAWTTNGLHLKQASLHWITIIGFLLRAWKCRCF